MEQEIDTVVLRETIGNDAIAGTPLQAWLHLHAGALETFWWIIWVCTLMLVISNALSKTRAGTEQAEDT